MLTPRRLAFVLVPVLVLAGAIALFIERGNDRWPVTADFADTTGVYVGNEVQYLGVPVGEITSAGGRISTPGGLIHEVGTCRMGADPKTSVLNPYCQMHDIRNVYVFGGGPFVTTGSYHPTLTMMALTVRGCEHLVDQTKKRNI